MSRSLTGSVWRNERIYETKLIIHFENAIFCIIELEIKSK